MAKDEEEVSKADQDKFLAEAMANVGSAFGGTVGSTLEEDVKKGIYGVPLPYFCQRWFFGSNVLPVQKVYLLAGEPGTCKTALMLYFSKLIADANGMAFIQHTEDKWPDTLPPSIMGAGVARLRVQHAETAQAWMASEFVAVKNFLSKEPLNRHPMLLGTDSIHGAQGKDRSKKLSAAKGVVERDFSEIARILSDWYPDFTKLLRKSSAIAMFILHLKGKDDTLTTAGGSSKDFFSSYTIHLKNPYKHVAPDKTGEIRCWMHLTKDSYGAGKASMPLAMEWDFDEKGVQQTRFQWAEATTFLLTQWLSDDPDKKMPAKHGIQKIFGKDKIEAHDGGSKGKLFSAKGVGERLTAQEFGEALEQNKDLVKELDEVMHITQRNSVAEHFARIDAEIQAQEDAKRRGGKKKDKDAKKDDKPDLAAIVPPQAPVL